MFKTGEENSSEHEENDNVDSFDQDDMYNMDTEAFFQKEEDEEDSDLDAFRIDNDFDFNADDDEENDEEEEGDDSQDSDDLFSEDDDSGSDSDNDDSSDDSDDLDLENFNKKFNTEFKSQEDLRNFLKSQDSQEENKAEEEAYDKAVSENAMFEPLLEFGDEELMRRQFQADAIQNNQDINDEDVQIDIEEKIQTLKDNQILDIKAGNVRRLIKERVSENKSLVSKVDTKKEEAKQATEKQNREALQNEFVGLFNSENFYGVDLDKKIINEAYKEAASGKFIEAIQQDKKALAELVLISKVKEKIFKKASGLTYNDGMKAVLDEFKSKEKPNRIVKAQNRGTTASSRGIDSLASSLLK